MCARSESGTLPAPPSACAGLRVLIEETHQLSISSIFYLHLQSPIHRPSSTSTPLGETKARVSPRYEEHAGFRAV